MKRLFITSLWIMGSFLVNAQEVPQVTDKIFFKNVHLNVQPGVEASLGHILIEDGIIQQVGSAITAPFDAKVIEADSMHAYPGFIASLSSIGLEKPKESTDRPKVERTGYPPNDIAGITPEKSIADIFKPSDRSITDFRKAGFTIAHTVPYGRMMPGKGSIISLNGKPYTESVISKDNSLYATWRTARQVFPATLIGIMSKWRELYRNAELADQHHKNYELNRRNKKRPDYDAATTALFPIVSKNQSVFFHAEKHRDIARTLQLQRELGFNLVISEAKDIDRILPSVKSSGAQILLSLDLPDKMKEKKEKDTTASTETASADSESIEIDEKSELGSKDKDDDETTQDDTSEALKQRKKDAIMRYTSQAKSLASENIPIAFSFMDVKAKDVLSNLRRMIKEGLSEENALAALTTNAAQAIGISDIAGTLEPGKIANVVLSTGPIFEEKSKIKWVIVDGTIHEYEIKEKKKKSAADSAEEPADISGLWDYSIEVPGMVLSGTMNYIKSDDTYEVSITNSQTPGQSVDASDVEVDGSNVTMAYSPPMGGANILIEMDLTFDGDTFEGNVTAGDFGTFEITGQKSSPE